MILFESIVRIQSLYRKALFSKESFYAKRQEESLIERIFVTVKIRRFFVVVKSLKESV